MPRCYNNVLQGSVKGDLGLNSTYFGQLLATKRNFGWIFPAFLLGSMGCWLRIVAYMKEVKSQLESSEMSLFSWSMRQPSAKSFADQMTCDRIVPCQRHGSILHIGVRCVHWCGLWNVLWTRVRSPDHQLPLFPIKLCDQWPPAPQNNERGIYARIRFVFKKSLACTQKICRWPTPRGVADKIAESVARMGIFRN